MHIGNYYTPKIILIKGKTIDSSADNVGANDELLKNIDPLLYFYIKIIPKGRLKILNLNIKIFRS